MSYTPVELRHVRLPRGLFGYKRSSVDELLEDVADSFEDTWRERGVLSDRLEALDKQIGEHRHREELLSHALVAAEQAAGEIRSQAERAAEVIIDEARQKARETIRAAGDRRELLIVESRRIEAVLRASLELLSAKDAELRSLEQEASAALEAPAAPAGAAAEASIEQAPEPKAIVALERSRPVPVSEADEPSGEFHPVSLPPVEERSLPEAQDDASDTDEYFDQGGSFERPSLLRRLAGGGGRDLEDA